MRDFFSNLLLGDLDQEQRTAVWRIGLTFLILGHVSWACGWLPGISGFAMAADYERLAGTVDKVTVSLLEKDIIQAQERFCLAIRDRNPEAQRYALDRRRKLMQQWLDLKDKPFALPTCQELGIT